MKSLSVLLAVALAGPSGTAGAKCPAADNRCQRPMR